MVKTVADAALAKIGKAAQQAIYNNDTVYHEAVPAFEVLPPIMPKSIVKPTSLDTVLTSLVESSDEAGAGGGGDSGEARQMTG